MLFLLLMVLLDFIVDYQWFEEVGYTSVFMAAIINKFRIGTPVFALMTVFLYLYFMNMKRDFYRKSRLIESNQDRKRYGKIILVLSLVLSFFISSVVAGSLWLDILKYINASDFSVMDPIFSKDVGFYIFKLPLLNQIISLLIFVAIVLLVATAIFYGVMISLKTPEMGRMQQDQEGDFQRRSLFSKEMLHLAVRQIAAVGFVIFVILALKFYLARYSLLFSSAGAVYGRDIPIWRSGQGFICFRPHRGFKCCFVLYAAYSAKYKTALYGPVLLVVISIVGNLAALGVQN